MSLFNIILSNTPCFINTSFIQTYTISFTKISFIQVIKYPYLVNLSTITNMLLYSCLIIRSFNFSNVGNKGKWPLFKASCLHARQVAVTCRRSISVVRNLTFLTPFFIFLTIINIILSTNCSYVILPCVTNTDQQLTSLLYYRAAKYS